MNIPLPSTRIVFGLLFAAVTVLIAVALYLQHRLGLEPCPLCISQRVAFILAGIAALLGALHNPGRRGQRVWGFFVLAFAIAGAALACRQLWLQSLPKDQVPACAPSLDYILEVFPWRDALEMLLKGDGSCAEIGWTLLGLGIPAWSLLAFIGIALCSLRPWLADR